LCTSSYLIFDKTPL